ncbi:MAG: guanylate kinase [Bacteroidales bacterium]|jgi:guanylate kinase|nr:guanylate kinase [Bacteroidales bacterium]MDD2824765.1 guanylate kinase [Bacteroidales bacterium]MDD3100992.1 guanylate kinase [Bacteroidales bacterium]MDD3639827.1 guanylate kinase [Bacteroidales bacterium]MDD3944552.1 guanylate kinase [Bacteroidales bacterium]
MNAKKALIFSAPSGAGKSTVVNHLMETFPRLDFSITATTRPRRGNEENGKEYYFISREEFLDLIEKDAFVEWEEVYKDRYYGTLKLELERIWNGNKVAVFDVDVKGGINLKKKFGRSALSVFIAPPTLEVLRERLTRRGTDSAGAIEERLAKASLEMQDAPHFDVVLVNDRLEDTLDKATEIVAAFIF